jgi:hypothetical protein
MKNLLISTALLSALAAGSAVAAPAARIVSNEATATETTRTAGGPIQVGERCWTITDNSRGYGYLDFCDSLTPFARSRSQLDETFHSGDGGGGGGGGGGR